MVSINSRRHWNQAGPAGGVLACVLSMVVLGTYSLPIRAAGQETAMIANQMRDCGRIENRDRRLDCYDRLHESLVGNTPPATVPAEPREEPIEASIGRRDRKSLFGEKTERPPDVQMTLIKAEKDRLRRWTFYFDNGQVWRQINSGYVLVPDGDAVPATLIHGVLGSYDLRLADSKRKVKVKRIK